MSTTKSIIEKNPALADISLEELEELMKERQQALSERQREKRQAYETKKDALINELGQFAQNVFGMMADLKYEAFRELTIFREEMMEYGDIKGKEKNKGSYHLKNDFYKIEFSSQVNKAFDERATMAEAKLKEFLATFVRKNKKDQKYYTMIMTLLERTKGGDFDINLINRLYAIENEFDNPLWKEAIALFKESYSPYGTAQYIKFSVKNQLTNGYDAIVLDFAKLKSMPTPTIDGDDATEDNIIILTGK